MSIGRSDTSLNVTPAPDASSACVRSVDLRPGRRCTAVVEGGLADELDLDSAVQALHRPHEHVVGVVVGRRPRVRRHRVLVIPGTERERVSDDGPARRRLPGRLEDVRPRQVGPCRRVGDPERAEAEEARFAVEEAAEDAGSVEGGMHSQSIAPSGATSAPVWQSDRKA